MHLEVGNRQKLYSWGEIKIHCKLRLLEVSYREEKTLFRRPSHWCQCHSTCLVLRLNKDNREQPPHVTIQDEVVPFFRHKYYLSQSIALYSMSSSQKEVVRKRKREEKTCSQETKKINKTKLGYDNDNGTIKQNLKQLWSICLSLEWKRGTKCIIG